MRACQLLLFGYSVRIGTLDSYKLKENWIMLRNYTGMVGLLNVGAFWFVRKLRTDFVMKIEFDTREKLFVVT